MTEQQAGELIKAINNLTYVLGLGISAGLTYAPASWYEQTTKDFATKALANVAQRIENRLSNIE